MKPLRSAKKIAVLRALQLGDMLCAVPALRALRAAYPEAKITLIGLPWAHSFVDRFHQYIDDLMVIPSVPNMPETYADPGEISEFISKAQQRHFDLAIQLHGSGIVTNGLLMQLGAAHIAGFYMAGYACPDKSRFLLWQEVEHEVLRGIRLMQELGFPTQGKELEFPIHDADFQELGQTLAKHSPAFSLSASYVCIHPGVRMLSRRWSYERFAETADRLAQQGMQIVLTGSSDEVALVTAVEQNMQMPAINLAGKTSLGALAALVSRAALVVCNDTGISHVTAAVATPSVVVCCGSDPLRWAPLNRELHRVLTYPVFCRPCMHRVCPIGHPCASNISVEMVVTQANELLERFAASPLTTPMIGNVEHAMYVKSEGSINI